MNLIDEFKHSFDGLERAILKLKRERDSLLQAATNLIAVRDRLGLVIFEDFKELEEAVKKAEAL